MKTLIVGSLLAAGLLPVRIGAQQATLTPQDSALHALNRLAYGPRPGEVARVAAAGGMRWIDRQLAPHPPAHGAPAPRAPAVSPLTHDRPGPAAPHPHPQREGPARPQARVRPFLGRGPELFPPPRDPAQPDSQRQRALERQPKGLNENYARELLELHTLGVDGGYTQQDVIEVARIFTGWGITRPQEGGAFQFHDWAHDRGEKRVLDVRFPPGRGQEEGVRLLHLGANQPATMHHVSGALCQRFVNDDPPDGCVDDAVAAWKRSHGDIREVLRAIVHGADFWAASNVRAKVK